MILELDTAILDRIPDIKSISQLAFITLVLNENQNNRQDIHKLLSLVSEEDIQDLKNKNLIQIELTAEGDRSISKSELLTNLLKEDKSMFDQFYEEFPIYVTRPDGTKGFLRANINKCRKEYNRIVGKSKAMHEHIMNCLRFEVSDKMLTGKLGYMKTMWKWLTQHEWEAVEDQMNTNIQNYVPYGTRII